MHMADALLSPAVGGTMWAATGAVMTISARKINKEMDERNVPLMGVMGAFVFAAQMINFTIPGTGSSGHLGGGMLLAILLGPYAAFLVMASILTVQALFFADGGLLALGCNIINLGAIPSFIVYPLVCRPLLGHSPEPGRMSWVALVSAVLALQLGALGVVLETTMSGVSELPLVSFLAVMQPIHLAIGLVEGTVTAAVVSFVRRADPSVLQTGADKSEKGGRLGQVVVALLIVAVLTGTVMSWFASQNPDGLEWSIARVTGSEEIEDGESGVHGKLAVIQEKTAVLPDYGFKENNNESQKDAGTESDSWPTVDAGTSLSGLVGGIITLGLVILLGLVLKKRNPEQSGAAHDTFVDGL